jgi:hypothetical protein
MPWSCRTKIRGGQIPPASMPWSLIIFKIFSLWIYRAYVWTNEVYFLMYMCPSFYTHILVKNIDQSYILKTVSCPKRLQFLFNTRWRMMKTTHDPTTLSTYQEQRGINWLEDQVHHWQPCRLSICNTHQGRPKSGSESRKERRSRRHRSTPTVHACFLKQARVIAKRLPARP